MSIKHDRFMKKMGKKYPLALKYLDRNHSQARSDLQEDKDEGSYYVSTLQVFPRSGGVPKESIMLEILNYFTEINKQQLGIDECKLLFVVKGDDGEQNVVRNVTFKEPSFEEYEVEVTADCGQKVVLLFNDKEHYDMAFPVIEEHGYINKAVPEYIGEDPVIVGVQPLICGCRGVPNSN